MVYMMDQLLSHSVAQAIFNNEIGMKGVIYFTEVAMTCDLSAKNIGMALCLPKQFRALHSLQRRSYYVLVSERVLDPQISRDTISVLKVSIVPLDGKFYRPPVISLKGLLPKFSFQNIDAICST